MNDACNIYETPKGKDQKQVPPLNLVHNTLTGDTIVTCDA